MLSSLESPIDWASLRAGSTVSTTTCRPRYELPMIPDGMDLAGLYRLAAALREQGAA